MATTRSASVALSPSISPPRYAWSAATPLGQGRVHAAPRQLDCVQRARSHAPQIAEEPVVVAADASLQPQFLHFEVESGVCAGHVRHLARAALEERPAALDRERGTPRFPSFRRKNPVSIG
jgi:hypothetical protein